MNILEEIQNCSVEWKELGEVVEVLDSLRRPITKSQRISGDIPYYGANGIQDYVEDWIFDGTYILMGEDGSVIKNDNSPVLHWVTGKIWVNNHAHILAEVPEYALLKYVYYVLSQTDVADIVRGTPPKLNQKNLKSIKIPIPPLEIQEKIVQILDKFTDYVTELTSELTSRKKQYSYYRDTLLSFEDEAYQVEWKTLGEVAENLDNMRKPVAKGGRSLGIYPYYGASGIVDYVDSFIFDGDYLLISEDGANLVVRKTPIAFSISGKTWVNNHAHVLKFDNIINQKFVNYYLNYLDLSPYITGAAQPKLNQQNLNNIKIPYPSLEIQSRIVQVLDNFDMVCNDLNIGLPKEIELRQKQYEYFREKLLTFTAEGVYPDSGQWHGRNLT